jgi:hypothetical protein
LVRIRHLIYVLAVFAALGAGASAFAVSRFHADAPPKVEPIAFAPPASSPLARVPAREGLSQAMARFGGSAIAAAHIGSAPAEAATRGDLPWLYASVRVPSLRDGLDIEPMWEADLVEGAVADRVGTAKNIRDDFGGSTFDAVLPDGTRFPDQSGGLGDVTHGQGFSDASNASVEARVRLAIKAAGLEPISVKVLRPLGPAPVVVVGADDAATAAKNYTDLTKSLFGNPPSYEGYYLEIRGPDGTAIARGSASFRTGAGRFWVDPRWANVASVKTFGKRDAGVFATHP